MSIHTLKTLPKTMYLHRRCNGPLAVQWTTRDTYSTVNGYFPTVQWGTASGKYTFESLKVHLRHTLVMTTFGHFRFGFNFYGQPNLRWTPSISGWLLLTPHGC